MAHAIIGRKKRQDIPVCALLHHLPLIGRKRMIRVVLTHQRGEVFMIKIIGLSVLTLAMFGIGYVIGKLER